MRDYRAARYATAVGVFPTDKGAVGFRCACGFVVFARSRAALELSLGDHQTVEICPATRASVAADAGDDV